MMIDMGLEFEGLLNLGLEFEGLLNLGLEFEGLLQELGHCIHTTNVGCQGAFKYYIALGGGGVGGGGGLGLYLAY